MSETTKKFELGAQPTWAGREENGSFDESFIETLLAEDAAEQLISRGYCLVDLHAFDPSISGLYSKFHASIEQFFQMPRAFKEKYAMLQFDNQLNSPNQCHGYSEVHTLKEQFMMRCVGHPLATSKKAKSAQNSDSKPSGSNFTSSSSGTSTSASFESEANDVEIVGDSLLFPSDCDHFGRNGMQIYEKLDLLCRQLEHRTMKLLNKPVHVVEDVLDPVHKVNGSDPSGQVSDRFSTFIPDGYISSSIMDNFHYYPASAEKEDRFYNNHASHTDSGLMTVVVVTDEPGLEVFDQKLQKWVAIEEVFHQYCRVKRAAGVVDDMGGMWHRRFATCFWSDSVEYLNAAPGKDASARKLKALFHRVRGCEKERYSVVYKQRTAPLRTHCRYQEDYVLASIQSAVDKDSKNAYALWKESDAKGMKKFGNGVDREVLCWKVVIGFVVLAFVAYLLAQSDYGVL